jgi:hypothetical protein
MRFISALVASVAVALEPNPPNWDISRVFVVEPGDSSAQVLIDAALAENGGHVPPFNGEFSQARFAFLFKPGDHSTINMELGYYTTVHGLGRTPPTLFWATSWFKMEISTTKVVLLPTFGALQKTLW